MCGIAGLWRFGGKAEDALRACGVAMTNAIAYRGPDGDGHWIDPKEGIVLGHRRLAIVDITPTGHQPMISADGRIVITYNGELYNAAEIGAELAMPFRGTSDTEVLLEAIARFGIDGALQRANGLFAFAAFDRKNRVLHVARDRLGIKPVYWTRQRGACAFASELRALRAIGDFEFTVDPGSVASYLRHACIPGSVSIYREVSKLLPGRRVEISETGVRDHCYWDLASIARRNQHNPFDGSDADVVDYLDELLRDTVRRQMISDVPLGAFLSSGIDSSTVVAAMQAVAGRRVKTYSIGFGEKSFDESAGARAIATHLGTEHTELVLSSDDALAIVPKLPSIYDEPFADSSQLPTHLVSQLARSEVTVALSGDGGDEAFGGYVRYRGIPRLWSVMRYAPRGLRELSGGILRMLSPAAWDALGQAMPAAWRPAHFGDKIRKTARLVAANDLNGMYREAVSQWPDVERVMPGVAEAPGWSDGGVCAPDGLDAAASLRLRDQLGYLPDDILGKVDRASMGVSLEVRVPLLDHRVVEFGWRLPNERLMSGGEGKRPLRGVLRRYLPDHLISGPKIGFGVPLGDWLRGPLRGWAEDLLSRQSLDDMFDYRVVRERFDEHLSGRADWQYALWTVLQYQAWHRAWG